MSPTSGLGGVFVVVLDRVVGAWWAGLLLFIMLAVACRLKRSLGYARLPQTYVSAEQS